MATTYNNLFLDTRARLKKAGIEAAQLEARELVCYAADKSREQLYRDMSLYVSAELEKRVDDLVRRRLAGEPVAYIIGEWEFYGLPLDISQEVLIPRTDTELLAERGIARAKEAGEGARVLDLCAGSGCVGLAVAANVPVRGGAAHLQAERPPQPAQRPGHLSVSGCPGGAQLRPVGL